MVVGSQVGAYRLVQQIGEGGMGAVWLAEHTMLGRRAAVKLLHASFTTQPEIVRRFFNEARAATSISDPGIVQIFDFGHAADGQAFIAMELLEGEPLDRRLHRLGRLSLHDALRISRQVASSLGAAHARGIVHRDLKPENIFLVRDSEVFGGERAKILDFGIAKLGDQGGTKTQTNALMGTPVYMSPEQCRGAGNVDARSDVYSMGCLLFTLLTGRPPFLSELPGDLIVHHLTVPAPRISSVAPHLPSAVDALVARCLDKDPALRPQSGTELAVALAALVSSISDTQLPQPVPPPAAFPVVPAETTTLGGAAQANTVPPRSRRTAIGLGIALVAGLVMVAVIVSMRASEQGPVRATAERGSDPGLEPAAKPEPAKPEPAKPEPAKPELTSSALPKPEPPSPADAALPATVAIQITTMPSGARVYVGAEKKPRGTTPCTLELPRGDVAAEITIVRVGHVSQKRMIQPTLDATISIALEKVHAVVKPADGGDTDDTMNPFAAAKKAKP